MTKDDEISTFQNFKSRRVLRSRACKKARQDLRQMLTGTSRWIGSKPEPSGDELMDEIVGDIKEGRRREGQGVNVGLPSGLDTHGKAP